VFFIINVKNCGNIVWLWIWLFGIAFGDSALAPIVTVSFCAGVRRKRFSGKREIASKKNK
jgi:hypothetical protein